MAKRFVNNRKGTAEVIGSVMFIVIIMFFFSSVYLWHDQATRQMNDLASQKLNSPITMSIWTDFDNPVLQINDTGGVDVTLSRLWIDTTTNHAYINLTNIQGIPGGSLWIAAGSTRTITLNKTGVTNPFSEDGVTVEIPYSPPSETTVRFIVITTLGNTAACSYSATP